MKLIRIALLVAACALPCAAQAGAGAPEPQTPAEGEADRLLRQLKERNEPVGSRWDLRILHWVAGLPPVPDYPAIARACRVQGEVAVKVLVDGDGRVSAAQVESGHPLLRAAAVKAARRMRFSPVIFDGEPLKVVGVVIYNFKLQ